MGEATPMRRRNLLIAPFSLLLVTSTKQARCEAVRLGEKHLGEDWRLPRNSTIEIWPTEMGLDLSEAVSAVGDWSIPSNSHLIFRLPDGEHALSKQVVPRILSGDRMAILGNLASPEKCRIVWEKMEDAFYVAAGRCLGLVDGVTVEHVRPSSRGLGSAFLADAGGLIRCGANVRVRNLYYGFQARYGGTILCNRTHSYYAGDANYFAFNGGHIQAEGTLSEFAADRQKGLGGGFVAEYGGTINASGSIARHNALAGYVALSNGVIRAYDTRAEFNGRAGYYSNTGGVIVAHRGIAQRNCEIGVKLGEDGGRGFEGHLFKQADNYFDERYCKN